MKGRTVRRAVSIACSVVFVSALLLLARSYWRLDVIAFKVSKQRAAFVASQLGRIYVGVDAAANKTGYMTRAVSAPARGKQSLENRTGFAVGDGNASYIMVPHWFVLVLIVALAGCIQLGGRFSLRVMLMILPLIVLVLVLLACLHIVSAALPREQ